MPFDPDGATLATFVTAFEAAALNAAEVPAFATDDKFREGVGEHVNNTITRDGT